MWSAQVFFITNNLLCIEYQPDITIQIYEVAWYNVVIFLVYRKGVNMPIVLLIRHGESHSNAGLPTAHPKTVRLTKEGREQVENIPYVLQTTNLLPELIVISSYARSRQTARSTRKKFPFVPVEEWLVHEFTYLASWHTRHSTVHQRREWVEKYWEAADPTAVDKKETAAEKDEEKEESESFEQFIERVRDVIARLRQMEKDTIVVFSHEQFICALLWLLQRDQPEGKIDTAAMRDFRAFHQSHGIPNGAIVQLDMREGSAYGTFELITFHLEKMASIPTDR